MNQQSNIDWQQYMPLIQRIANHMMSQLPPSIDVQDLIQAGSLGLIHAIDRYTSEQGATFETYASHRIRGAMLDLLRQADWVPRSVRKQLRLVEKTTHTIEHKELRRARVQEVANELGMTLEQYRDVEQAQSQKLVYLEDFRGDEDESTWDERLELHSFVDTSLFLQEPAHFLEEREIKAHIHTVISRLPPRLVTIITLYHEEELNLREIGERLGITESRVCQLYHEAMQKIRTGLNGTYHGTYKKVIQKCMICTIISAGMYTNDEVDVILEAVPIKGFCDTHIQRKYALSKRIVEEPGFTIDSYWDDE